MRRKILPFLLAGALSIAAVAPAAAAQDQCNLPAAPQRGGAAALVALVQAVVIANVNVAACDINVDVLNNSLNNLLQNADIDVLNNILNNSPFLNDLTITVSNVANGLQINVLGGGITVPLTITIPA